MNCRMANVNDLPKIKAMFAVIIEKMKQEKIVIWDNVYPSEVFIDDINKDSFYIIEENQEIIAGFAMNKECDGEPSGKWEKPEEKGLYLERIGVNVNYTNCGVGSKLMECAGDIATKQGINYLRLFVVDFNIPAINFYKKNGFVQVEGSYQEIIEGGTILEEILFEKSL